MQPAAHAQHRDTSSAHFLRTPPAKACYVVVRPAMRASSQFQAACTLLWAVLRCPALANQVMVLLAVFAGRLHHPQAFDVARCFAAPASHAGRHPGHPILGRCVYLCGGHTGTHTQTLSTINTEKWKCKRLRLRSFATRCLYKQASHVSAKGSRTVPAGRSTGATFRLKLGVNTAKCPLPLSDLPVRARHEPRGSCPSPFSRK